MKKLSIFPKYFILNGSIDVNVQLSIFGIVLVLFNTENFTNKQYITQKGYFTVFMLH